MGITCKPTGELKKMLKQVENENLKRKELDNKSKGKIKTSSN